MSVREGIGKHRSDQKLCSTSVFNWKYDGLMILFVRQYRKITIFARDRRGESLRQSRETHWAGPRAQGSGGWITAPLSV